MVLDQRPKSILTKNRMTLKSLFPTFGPGITKVWLRNFLHFKYSFGLSIIWIVLEPVFYLSAIGYGLGSFVPNIEGKTYAEFFFPGLIATTVMMVAVLESTYNCFSKLAQSKIYSSLLLAPIGINELVWGEIFWCASKAMLGAFVTSFVAYIFGAFDSVYIFPGFLVLFLISLTFAALGLWVTSLATNYDSFIYLTSGFIVPIGLFSGTYFPLENLNVFLKTLAFFSPLTHGVYALRMLLYEEINWMAFAFNVFFLFILTVIFAGLAYRGLKKRLL